MESHLRKHIGELSKHTRNEIQNIRQEIQRETRQSPKLVQQALADVDFRRIVKEAASDTSPIVQQIVKEINVAEMVQQGLASDDERVSGRRREAKSGRGGRSGGSARARGAGRTRDSQARHYEELEVRLEQLMNEVEEIRREMRRVRTSERGRRQSER